MFKANTGCNLFHNHYLDPVFFSSIYISSAIINFLILSSGEQKMRVQWTLLSQTRVWKWFQGHKE